MSKILLFDDFKLKAIANNCKDIGVVKIEKGYHKDINLSTYVVFFKYKNLTHATQIAHNHLNLDNGDFNEFEYIVRRLVSHSKSQIDICLYESSTKSSQRRYGIFILILNELSCFKNIGLIDKCPYTYDEKISEFVNTSLDIFTSFDTFNNAMSYFFNDWKNIALDQVV